MRRFVLFIIISFSFSLSVYSQNDPLKDLRIVVEAQRDTIYQGEPLYLYFHFINQSNYNYSLPPEKNTLTLTSDLNLSSDLSLFIQYQGFIPRRYAIESESQNLSYPKLVFSIPHGRTWTFVSPVCYDWKTISGHQFSEEGIYLIEGQFRVKVNGLVYNKVIEGCTVEVLPAPDSESEVFKTLNYPEFALAFTQNQFAEPADAEIFRNLIENYPESLYGTHLKYSLALSEMRNGNFQVAEELFNDIFEQNNNLIPVEHYYQNFGELLSKSGQVDSLYELLWEFWNYNEDIFLIDVKNPLFDKYMGFKVSQDDQLRVFPWELLD